MTILKKSTGYPFDTADSSSKKSRIGASAYKTTCAIRSCVTLYIQSTEYDVEQYY